MPMLDQLCLLFGAIGQTMLRALVLSWAMGGQFIQRVRNGRSNQNASRLPFCTQPLGFCDTVAAMRRFGKFFHAFWYGGVAMDLF